MLFSYSKTYNFILEYTLLKTRRKHDHLCFVSGYIDIAGNMKYEELARRGSSKGKTQVNSTEIYTKYTRELEVVGSQKPSELL